LMADLLSKLLTKKIAVALGLVTTISKSR
jgi:hypothetical protein